MTTHWSDHTETQRPSRLLDVLDRVLDKGIVIDAWLRMSAVGIDLMTVDARVVVASLHTYLMRAEAVQGITWDQFTVPTQVARTVAAGQHTDKPNLSTSGTLVGPLEGCQGPVVPS